VFNAASPNDLIAWSRALGHGLDVGLSPVKVFRGQANSGPSKLRSVAQRLADRLETGSTLDDALKPEAKLFPPLFLQLIAVGEQAGRLPDIFRELEDHFETVRDARKALIRALLWPAFMYVSAILIVAALLLILGVINPKMDVLGIGITGMRAALLWLGVTGAFTFAVLAPTLYIANNQQLRPKGEAFLLNIPGLAGCFRAFALSRFCMAYHMTAEAGLRADRCLKFSLTATANDAYAAKAESAAKAARRGDTIPDILAPMGTKLFPDEFLSSLHVGEDSGRLPEVLHKQAKFYAEESRRKLKLLSVLLGGAVYAMVGIIVIVLIFRLFMTAYMGPMNDAMKAADNPDAWMRGR
jgi:type IV pilus assembly protein PilC